MTIITCLCTGGLNQSHVVVYRNTYLLGEKIPRVSGPTQFKPMLFKDGCVENSRWIMSCECEELLWVEACLVHVGVSARWLSDQSAQGKGKGSGPSPGLPLTTTAPLFMIFKQGCPHFADMAYQKQAILLIFQLRLFQGRGEVGLCLDSSPLPLPTPLNGEGPHGPLFNHCGCFSFFFFFF